MKETKLKLHPCHCGGEMEIKKVAQNGGMDGTYWDWELTCNKCGLIKYYAADGFYGRPYKTFEEVVDDWNKKKEEIIKDLEQKPCEDVISRQEVLSYIYNDLGLGDEENGSDIERMIELERLYKYVKSLKPVNPQPKTGWIPVSEGMPKVTDYYLIQHTRKYCNDKMAVAFYSVEEAHVDPNYTWEFATHSDVQEVIAWMPLPKQYEAEK